MYTKKCIKTYLGYTSALRYWRAIAAGKLPDPKPRYSTVVCDYARSLREVESCRYMGWDITEEPIHILVASAKDVNRTSRLTSHICKGEFPPYSFFDVGHELVLPSPQLLLVQLAQQEDELTIAELAMEFCGYYSIDEASPEGMVYHTPFTNVHQLKTGLKALSGRHGASKALRALRYVCDNAASPRETESCLALTLPARLGGAGLPLPRCNAKVEIPQTSSFSKQYFFGDLVWPEYKLIVEYNGKKYHTEAELDQHRRDLLEHAGWQVRVISKKHTNDDEAFIAKLKQISRAASKRLRSNQEATSHLRKHLFSGVGQMRRETKGGVQTLCEFEPYPDYWE